MNSLYTLGVAAAVLHFSLPLIVMARLGLSVRTFQLHFQKKRARLISLFFSLLLYLNLDFISYVEERLLLQSLQAAAVLHLCLTLSLSLLLYLDLDFISHVQERLLLQFAKLAPDTTRSSSSAPFVSHSLPIPLYLFGSIFDFLCTGAVVAPICQTCSRHSHQQQQCSICVSLSPYPSLSIWIYI